MENTSTGSFNRFYLEQARIIRGISEYKNFELYVNTPLHERGTLDMNVIHDYETVVKVIELMKSYGTNHWWVLLDSTEIKNLPKNVTEKQFADLRRKARVYYQVFHCGFNTMLVRPGQLSNDINDLLQHTGKTITSWMLKSPLLFEFYKEDLRRILDNDRDFQAYLRNINSE